MANTYYRGHKEDGGLGMDQARRLKELETENRRYGYKRIATLLRVETFYTLKEAQVILEQWRHHYNHIRPHTSLGYKPPAPLARTNAPIRAKRFT